MARCLWLTVRPTKLNSSSSTAELQTTTGRRRVRNSSRRCSGGIGTGSRSGALSTSDLGHFVAQEQRGVRHARRDAQLIEQVVAPLPVAQPDTKDHLGLFFGSGAPGGDGACLPAEPTQQVERF